MSDFMRSNVGVETLLDDPSRKSFQSLYIVAFLEVLKERNPLFLDLEDAPFVVEKFSCWHVS